MRGARIGAFAVIGAALIAACGSDSDMNAATVVGDPFDASGPWDGNPATTPDGNVPTLPDGAPIDSGHDASSDAMADADADIDASVDAGEDADAGGPVGPVITYKHYDINHVLSTGASDSVANGGTPVLSTSQPFGNMSFNTGVFLGGTCDGSGCKVYQTPASFVPLKEGDSFFSGNPRETISSGFANQATYFASQYFANLGVPMPQHDMMMSQHGRSGNPYWCLRWQTENLSQTGGPHRPCYFLQSAGYQDSFEEAMKSVTDAKALADGMGKTYVVRAVTYIGGQGESDGDDGTPEINFKPPFLKKTDGSHEYLADYKEAIFDLQWDYDYRVKQITGQTEDVVMFISQFGSFSKNNGSIIPQRQLDAHIQSNGKVNIVTPNYPFEHYSDCLHYTNHSQRKLGAYFAKAYQKVIIEGKKWEPTRPDTITRAGNVITIKYVVPVPPLVIDTTRVTGDNNNFAVRPFYGFIFRDSTMSAKITDVQVSGPDTVTITLDKTPTGANMLLHYAFETQTQFRCPGPTQGARGNIRDSDPTLGYNKDAAGNPYELFNWSVAFEMAVP